MKWWKALFKEIIHSQSKRDKTWWLMLYRTLGRKWGFVRSCSHSKGCKKRGVHHRTLLTGKGMAAAYLCDEHAEAWDKPTRGYKITAKAWG